MPIITCQNPFRLQYSISNVPYVVRTQCKFQTILIKNIDSFLRYICVVVLCLICVIVQRDGYQNITTEQLINSSSLKIQWRSNLFFLLFRKIQFICIILLKLTQIRFDTIQIIVSVCRCTTFSIYNTYINSYKQLIQCIYDKSFV